MSLLNGCAAVSENIILINREYQNYERILFWWIASYQRSKTQSI